MNATPPQKAAQEHSAALEAFAAAARAVPDEAWETPIAAGGWSPAQVAEHVRMTYVLVQNELSGGSGIRIRTPWWLRLVLRFRMLPRILASGTLPEGARAPREIRPGDGPFPRDQVLAGLQVAARNVEETLVRGWDDPNCHMTHHIFGQLTPPMAMRFGTVHTAHHARQLAAVRTGGRR
jgi:DinB superfamily